MASSQSALSDSFLVSISLHGMAEAAGPGFIWERLNGGSALDRGLPVTFPPRS
jgi:hypothetical protein